MTTDEARRRAEDIVHNSTDGNLRAKALEWLQVRWPDVYGEPPPSHQLPIRPEQQARINREVAAGTAPATRAQGQINPPTFGDKLEAAIGDTSDSQYQRPQMERDASAGVANLLNGFTMGASGSISDAYGVDSPRARAGDNPTLGTTLHAVGGVEGGLAGPANVVGRGMSGLVGLAESRVPALAETALGRVAGHTAAGVGTGGVVGAAESANAGGSPLKGALHGALWSLPFAGLPAGLGEAGRWVANRLFRNSPRLQDLEDYGFTPTPVPFKPTKSTSSEPGAPSSPSEALDMPANAMSRGQLGREAADTVQDELAHLRRTESRRAGEELGDAVNRQGGRSLSVEDDIRLIDEELANPGAGIDETMKRVLKNARKMLTGEMEPSADIFTMEPVKQGGPSPAPSPPSASTRYQDLRTQRQIGMELEREAGPGVRVDETGTPLEPQIKTVGTGDVYARVGEAPNHVRSAADLNQIRDALDRAMNEKVFQTGVDKTALPIYRLANQMRQRIRTEAPGIGLANRRSHAARRKLERTEDRLRGNTDDSEALTDQIANAGNPESTAAGAREARLGPPERIPQARRKGKFGEGKYDRGDLNLREQFPESRLAGDDLDVALDAPRLLGAEESLNYRLTPSLRHQADVAKNRVLYPIARAAGTAFGSEVDPAMRTILNAAPTVGQRGQVPVNLGLELSPIFQDPRLGPNARLLWRDLKFPFQSLPTAGDAKRRP